MTRPGHNGGWHSLIHARALLPPKLARARGLIIGMSAQIAQYLSWLLLLPLIVTRLSVAETGIWYVMMATQGLLMVVDFGFQPTFARQYAAAFAGVTEFRKEGLAEAIGQKPNLPLLRATLDASRRLYALLAGGTYLVLQTAGLAYAVWLAQRSGLSPLAIGTTWSVFSLSLSIGCYFLWVSPMLLGAGRIEQNYLYMIVGRAGFAVIGALVLLAGGGLLALALCLLVTDIISRLVAIAFLRPLMRPLPPSSGSSERHHVLRTTWHNAGRMGVVALSAYIITRCNLFAASSFLGLGMAASFAVSLQLLNAVSGLAQLPMSIALSRLVAARVANDRQHLQRLFLGAFGLYHGLFLTGAAFVLVAAPFLFELIGSRVVLLPVLPFLLLAVMLYLEGQHSVCAFVLTTANRVPFVVPAVLTAIAVPLASGTAIWLGGGITGMILSQLLVQAAYSNWRWPLEVWREFWR